VEVVLASGEIVVANDSNQYADLIQGIRGGGGNFGIVTKFTFQAHDIPKHVFAGNNVYMAPTLASAVGVMENFDKAVHVCVYI
jgi:FAD/FMN-containing dehydrogenase